MSSSLDCWHWHRYSCTLELHFFAICPWFTVTDMGERVYHPTHPGMALFLPSFGLPAINAHTIIRIQIHHNHWTMTPSSGGCEWGFSLPGRTILLSSSVVFRGLLDFLSSPVHCFVLRTYSDLIWTHVMFLLSLSLYFQPVCTTYSKLPHFKSTLDFLSDYFCV